MTTPISDSQTRGAAEPPEDIQSLAYARQASERRGGRGQILLAGLADFAVGSTLLVALMTGFTAAGIAADVAVASLALGWLMTRRTPGWGQLLAMCITFAVAGGLTLPLWEIGSFLVTRDGWCLVALYFSPIYTLLARAGLFACSAVFVLLPRAIASLVGRRAADGRRDASVSRL